MATISIRFYYIIYWHSQTCWSFLKQISNVSIDEFERGKIPADDELIIYTW